MQTQEPGKISAMINDFLHALVTLFVVIDPLGCVIIFSSLTVGTNIKYQRYTALRITFVAAAILLFFTFFGEGLIRALGVSMDAFSIAGGSLLFLVAIEMVIEKRSKRRQQHSERVYKDIEDHQSSMEDEDISVFPLAIPMIAGPGTLATVMLLSGKPGPSAKMVTLGATSAILLLTLIAMLLAGVLVQKIKKPIIDAITRLLGVILAALATQFILDGIQGFFDL